MSNESFPSLARSRHAAVCRLPLANCYSPIPTLYHYAGSNQRMTPAVYVCLIPQLWFFAVTCGLPQARRGELPVACFTVAACSGVVAAYFCVFASMNAVCSGVAA